MVKVGQNIAEGISEQIERVLGFFGKWLEGKELRTLRLDRKTSTIRQTRCVRSFRDEVQRWQFA